MRCTSPAPPTRDANALPDMRFRTFAAQNMAMTMSQAAVEVQQKEEGDEDEQSLSRSDR